jgi:hypothetical protein
MILMSTNWRKPLTWPMTWRVLAGLFGAVYLPLGYVIYGWGADVAPAVPTTPPSIHHYETACQTAARNAYGVPLANEAHAQWQRDHLGAPEGTAYNRAALACPQPAKWDFDNMILVGTE